MSPVSSSVSANVWVASATFAALHTCTTSDDAPAHGEPRRQALDRPGTTRFASARSDRCSAREAFVSGGCRTRCRDASL
jgi:hypothetical protein